MGSRRQAHTHTLSHTHSHTHTHKCNACEAGGAPVGGLLSRVEVLTLQRLPSFSPPRITSAWTFLELWPRPSVMSHPVTSPRWGENVQTCVTSNLPAIQSVSRLKEKGRKSTTGSPDQFLADDRFQVQRARCRRATKPNRQEERQHISRTNAVKWVSAKIQRCVCSSSLLFRLQMNDLATNTAGAAPGTAAMTQLHTDDFSSKYPVFIKYFHLLYNQTWLINIKWVIVLLLIWRHEVKNDIWSFFYWTFDQKSKFNSRSSLQQNYCHLNHESHRR